MKVVACTHRGNVRPINEDSFLMPENDGLVLVADGMGGHQAGEVASAMAASTIRACAQKAAGREITVRSAVSWVRKANKGIYQAASEDLSRAGMGTTLTFLYFMPGHAMLAHVGDSRCYQIRDGSITQLTRDHSLVAELVRKGEITPEQAKIHPYRNIITRALGTDSTVAVDAQDIDTEKNDIYLLCSDGLSNCVSVPQIEETLARTPFYEAADALVQKALEGGGLDNITVLLMQVEAVEENNG